MQVSFFLFGTVSEESSQAFEKAGLPGPEDHLKDKPGHELKTFDDGLGPLQWSILLSGPKRLASFLVIAPDPNERTTKQFGAPTPKHAYTEPR